MAKKIGDILSFGLILVSIYIIVISLRERGILMLLGTVGGAIVIAVESWFLLNWVKKWQ